MVSGKLVSKPYVYRSLSDNKVIDKASQGKYKTWGNAVEDWANGYIRADNGEKFNPFGIVGTIVGGNAPYKARIALYNQKSPIGYKYTPDIDGIKPFSGSIREMIKRPHDYELSSSVLDFLNPFSIKPKDTPYWKAVMQNDDNNFLLTNFTKGVRPNAEMPLGAWAEYRDMMYRKALGFPEGKNGTIFVDNGDGTWGLDMEKMNQIRRQYGGNDYDNTILVESLPDEPNPDGTIPFGTTDHIAGVGGEAKAVHNPKTNQTTITDNLVFKPI